MRAKYYYYVGVKTDDGMRFVTKLDNNKFAHWDGEQTPLLMSLQKADDIVYGLVCNGYYAVTVKSLFEITRHFTARKDVCV